MAVLPSPSSAFFPAISKPSNFSLLNFSRSILFPSQSGGISCSSSWIFGFRRFPRRCGASAGDVDTFTESSGYLFDLSAGEVESLTDYSSSKIAAIYRRRPLLLLRRLFQIGTTFGKWFGLRYIDGLMDRSELMFETRASELRRILVELGPAYIKIAQAVSSRPDLIPPSYLNELSLLQDQIAPFSSEVAFNTIEEELGSSIDELFSEISPVPIAAASLGQVYQARLRLSGRVVAVKVQRPGVQAAISLDILILRFFAGLLRRVGKLNTDLQAVVDEWASSLFRVNRIECRRWTTRKKRKMVLSLGNFMEVYQMYWFQKCLCNSVLRGSLQWNGLRVKS